MADIVGFGIAGVTVALATGGGHFAAPSFVLGAFGAATFRRRWVSENQFPRAVGDVNGDRMADIIGFGNAGVTVALATGDGHFAAPSFVLDAFGAANFGGGWASQDQFPRFVADVNEDGMADIVGFGNAGVTRCARHRRRALCGAHAHAWSVRSLEFRRRLEQRKSVSARGLQT